MQGFGASPLETMAAQAMLRGVVFCDAFTFAARYLTGTATALPANGSMEIQIQIGSDSDFLIQSRQLVAWSAAGVIIANPDYLIKLTTAGSGRQLMAQDVPVLSYFGSYAATQYPGRVPMPKLIQANSVLSVLLTNRTAVAPNRVDVVLDGFKVFYIRNAQTGEQGDRQTIFHVL